MEMKNQAKFHALKYILALKSLLKTRGAHVHDKTKAQPVSKSWGKSALCAPMAV
jgi:hypothetical protein